MFFLPFVFAGCFMLTVLNPRYATTLLSQAIPQTRLLGRAVSPIVGFLSGAFESLPGTQHLLSVRTPLSLPSSSNILETITVGRRLRVSTSKPGICGLVDAPFRTLAHDDTCFDGPSEASQGSTEGLELLVLFLLLCLLWGACSSVVDKLRVPQTLLAATSVVEEIAAQPGPRALTPSSSVEFGDVCLDEAEEECAAIPAQLNFVTPDGDEISKGGSSFILNTRAATDAILAIPLRVRPGSMSPPTGSLEELDALTLTPPNHIPAQDDELSSGMALGITRLMVQFGRIPPATNQEGIHRAAKTPTMETHKDTDPALSCQPFVLPRSTAIDVDLNACAPRARSRTYCALSPLLEEAVTFAVNRAADLGKDAASAMTPSNSGPSHAFIEEIVEPVHQCGTQSDARRTRSPHRQHRPKQPPITVWPRIPLEARRSRTPSSQPIRMTTEENTANSWNPRRRSRTVTSGA